MEKSQRKASRTESWCTRDVLFIALSAFFADMGYQAVTVVFPLVIIIKMNEPAYVYGLILALSYGAGSAFSLIGGKFGDRFGKKKIALAGNLLIPLMSVSVLFPNLIILGALFVFGWWARYFRTPVRRAWLVEVSDPAYRSKIFGFLHALDIGGGIIAVGYSVVLVLLRFPLQDIILVTALPILISSLALAFAKTTPHKKFTDYTRSQEHEENVNDTTTQDKRDNSMFRAILISATLFGFSFYALGFPVVTVARSEGGDVYGILMFGIYLAVSSIAGYLLGSLRGKRPLRTLWSLGYLVAAVSSLTIGLSYFFNAGLWLYYLGGAGLGFSVGSVETFEPVMTAALSKSRMMSTRMGYLTSSRATGLFVSNIVMGILFTIGEFYSYVYASFMSLAAALILAGVELRARS